MEKKKTAAKETGKTPQPPKSPPMKKTTAESGKKDVKPQKTGGPAEKTANTVPKSKTAPPSAIAKEKKATAKEQWQHVLFVCSEAQPFAGTGGLSDVTGSLPKAINIQKTGVEIRVILPLYEGMNRELRDKLEFVKSIYVPVAWRSQYCGLFKLEHDGVVFYFIDNEYYFKRHNLYGYYDDGERFSFFSRAVLEIMPHLGWKVDILHCHDWHTALVPIFYKLFYMRRNGYENIKTIFTIHNIEYQGIYGKEIIEDVFGIPEKEYDSIEHNGNINLMKGAIDYSDVVTTVSPTYAGEIADSFCAHGLESVLNKNKHKLTGILNGIDTDFYDPERNPSLFQNYNSLTLEKKAENKTELQKMIGLPVNPSVPIIAVISRLAPHKGLELIKFALQDIIMHDVQLIILGTGNPALEEYFSHIQVEFNKKISTVIAYNKDLAQKIYAGADIFLMPSKNEPCGLSQMIASRYGTVPLVRATGGLKDTIKDIDESSDGNGFVFYDFDVLAMTKKIDRALELFNKDKKRWQELMQKAMSMDFGWSGSAKEYIKLYNQTR